MKKLVGYTLWFTGVFFAGRQLWRLSPGLALLLAWCMVAFVGLAIATAGRREVS